MLICEWCVCPKGTSASCLSIGYECIVFTIQKGMIVLCLSKGVTLTYKVPNVLCLSQMHGVHSDLSKRKCMQSWPWCVCCVCVCVCVCMCLLSTPLHFSFVRFIFITVPVFHYICFVFEMNRKRRDFSVCAVLALCKLYFLVYTLTLLLVWLARNWRGWVKAHRGMEPLRPVWKNMSVLRKDQLQPFFNIFFRNDRF